jgi:plasmid stability protein
MKRTTLSLDENLLRQLKEIAARKGRTLQSVANDLLRQALARPHRAASFRLRLQGWRAAERPGVDILDRDKLFDLMDGR